MKKVLLLMVCLAVPACSSAFRSVDYPAAPQPDWVLSGWAGASGAASPPGAEQVKAFGEEPAPILTVRAAAGPDDFYGSKLFDGLEFTLQPLDAEGRPVRKLGSLTAVLYPFDPETLSGKGPELLSWRVPASRMAGLWKDGGVNRGYHMKLAWAKRPTAKFAKLEVHFETLTGGKFSDLITLSSFDQPRYRWLKK